MATQFEFIGATTPQFRIGYDASNLVSFAVSSVGDVTITPSGGDVSFVGNLAVTGTLTFDSLSVTGDATIGGTLGVTGATTLSSTLTVSGKTVVNQIDISGSIATGGANRLVLANDGAGGSQLWALGTGPTSSGNFAFLTARSDLSNSFTAISVASGGAVTMPGTLTLSAYGGGTGEVSVGAVDSGGTGFRVLRVPN